MAVVGYGGFNMGEQSEQYLGIRGTCATALVNGTTDEESIPSLTGMAAVFAGGSISAALFGTEVGGLQSFDESGNMLSVTDSATESYKYSMSGASYVKGAKATTGGAGDIHRDAGALLGTDCSASLCGAH